MSIILKGIDMPKHGETKRIVLYDNGDIVVDEDGWDEDGNRFYKTTYDVQAIQIPKNHGRLIDASELIKSYMRGTKTGIDDFYDTIDIIDNAPTILEAEEEQ